MLAIILICVNAFPAMSSAAEPPPASNFDTGKILRAADLKNLLQFVLDLATRVGNGTGYFSARADDNSITTGYDRLRMRGNSPGIYLEESDQLPYREDYGHWRIIADQNALFFEDWERRTPGEGEYAQQDEFLSFHRTQTPASDGTGNHIIQWNYDFVGLGARDLKIAANWASPIHPQTPRTLTLASLNAGTNSLVPAIEIVPNGSKPRVTIPSGPLDVGGPGASGMTLYDTATGRPYCVRITNGALAPTAGQCQ
ncbi:MAG: hypothetical protein RLZZ416_46 [Candidatus Parcubacteria bacterium]